MNTTALNRYPFDIEASTDRWQVWYQAALDRANVMATASKPRRVARVASRQRTTAPATAPAWYEPNPVRLPVEDPPNVVFLPRRAAKLGHYSSKGKGGKAA